MADMSTTKRPRVACSVWSSRCLMTPTSLSTSGPSGFSTVTAPWSCSWIFIARLRLRRRLHRQRHGERAALVDLRLDGDVPAVHPDHLAGQRQAQARAGDLRDPRVLGAVEALEDPLGVLGADADAGVGDGYRDLAVVHLDRDRHLAALGRVLQRVADEVVQGQ